MFRRVTLANNIYRFKRLCYLKRVILRKNNASSTSATIRAAFAEAMLPAAASELCGLAALCASNFGLIKIKSTIFLLIVNKKESPSQNQSPQTFGWKQ